MSGGSYNYLYYADSSDIGNKISDMQDMIDRLNNLGHHHLAMDTQLIINKIKDIDFMLDKIREVWKAVEYCDSGDWSKDEIEQEVKNYYNKNKTQS